jgi:tetratricopeptide (TPR) repeat protein
LTEYYSLIFQKDSQHDLQLGISSYIEALRFYTAETAPLNYAMTQNNLGEAYRALAAHQDPAGHLGRAVQAYNEALRFYTPETTPLDYAMTQNNLGEAYRNLAAHQDNKEQTCDLVQKAISSYLESMRFYKNVETPILWERVSRNLKEAQETAAELECSTSPLPN